MCAGCRATARCISCSIAAPTRGRAGYPERLDYVRLHDWTCLIALPTDRPDSAEPLLASRFQVVRPLGRGSFGQTFLARDQESGHDVAIKMLDPKSAADWKVLELFEREGAVLGGLRHQGIPQVVDRCQAEWNGTTVSLLVMEYIDGVSLARMIEEQRSLDPADVLHLLLGLLDILEHLHGRVPPILHRDIKPANIIVRPDGTPALVDFGSVSRVAHGPDDTGSTVAGTYGYMPYEQYMGQATPSSDLYALAATYLHLLTGRPPRTFMAEDGRIQVPDPLPGDPRLRDVLTRMLHPSPAERFPGARDVRHALLSPTVGGRTAVATSHRVPPIALALSAATPRPLEGAAKELFDRCAPTVWDFLDTSAKPGDSPGLFEWLGVVFVSVITFGILPMVFIGFSRARRRQLRRFIQQGQPGTAEVLSIGSETTAFGEKIAMVKYQYEMDGVLHRDADRVLPRIANRWHPGDRVPILYLTGEPFESVIVSPG